MNPDNIPLIRLVFRFGAEDRVLDGILLAGPLVVLAMIVGGRSPLTAAIVGLYVLSFAVYVVYNGITSGE
ncbi:hypothetical protein [Halosimplex sp. J119]